MILFAIICASHEISLLKIKTLAMVAFIAVKVSLVPRSSLN
jgi:hypothetical protein